MPSHMDPFHDFHRFNSSNWKKLLASGTGPRQIHHRSTTDPQQIHERCIIIRLTICSRWILVPKSWLWVHEIILTGGLPAPPGGGPVAPCAPLHTERLRLSGSPFFFGTEILVPRSWYQDPRSWYRAHNFFFSSRRRHTRCSVVSWARRCV